MKQYITKKRIFITIIMNIIIINIIIRICPILSCDYVIKRYIPRLYDLEITLELLDWTRNITVYN